MMKTAGLWLVMAALLGLGLIAPVWAAGKDALGPDGFPQDWRPEDFTVGVVSGTGGIVKTWAKPASSTVPAPKGKSINIKDLPHVPAGLPGGKKPVAGVSASLVLSPTLGVKADDVPGPDAVGALGAYGPLAGPRGVGPDVWKTTRVGTALPLLGRLGKEGGASLFTRRIVRRLLLTQAEPPAGAEGAGWLLARASALRALGFDEAAHGLLGKIPDPLRASDAALAKAWTETQLLAGNNASACNFARGQVMNAPSEPFWPMAVMVCQVLDGLQTGRMDGLALGLQLVTPAQKQVYGPLISLLEAVRDGGMTSPALPKGPMPPLMAVVYAAYPAVIDTAVMDKLPDIIWRRLVQTSALPLSLRAPAAEHLADRSELAGDGVAVGLLYAAFSFDDAQLADPVGSAQALTGAGKPFEARALLWRVASQVSAPDTLRGTAWQAWRASVLADGMPGLVRLMGVAGLKPSDGLAWMVPLVMRDALLAGDGATAAAWWPALRDNKTVSAELGHDKPLLALLASGFKPDASLWQAWENEAFTKKGKGVSGTVALRGSDASRVVAVMEEERAALPDGIWARLDMAAADRAFERVPDDLAARKVMQQLADHGERGMVLLRMALAVKGGMDNLSAEQAVWILKTLRAYGFEAEARALAAEAVLPAMVPVVRPVPKLVVNGARKLAPAGREIGGAAALAPLTDDGMVLPPPRVLPSTKKAK